MKLFRISLASFAIASLLVSSCSTNKNKKSNSSNSSDVKNHEAQVMKYANSITLEELKEQLYFYASDEMEGRMTGEPGEEVLVLSAHLDHIGVEDGVVFNGADDDGSGTIALLEIAEAFQKAKQNGHGPKRSILFLHVTAEEIGLYGSKYYSENPVYELENTIANLNIDMIGRIDPKREKESDYIYLIGSDMLSQDLHDISEAANKKYMNLDLDYTYNGKDDPNRFYYRSDHYNFAKNNVPVIFYFNGTHADYHKATDTPDKIEYELYQKRTQLIFTTAWELANGDKRPELTVQ